MKQFSLKEHLANPSRNVVTRDGRPARIICTDAKGKYSVIALVETDDTEITYKFNEEGKYLDGDEDNRDLFFASEKREGWVNIYRNGEGNTITSVRVYDTKEKAEKAKDNFGYLGTIHIEWEE